MQLLWLQALCRQCARVGRNWTHSWQLPLSTIASGKHMAQCSPGGWSAGGRRPRSRPTQSSNSCSSTCTPHSTRCCSMLPHVGCSRAGMWSFLVFLGTHPGCMTLACHGAQTTLCKMLHAAGLASSCHIYRCDLATTMHWHTLVQQAELFGLPAALSVHASVVALCCLGVRWFPAVLPHQGPRAVSSELLLPACSMPPLLCRTGIMVTQSWAHLPCRTRDSSVRGRCATQKWLAT